jgi:hypothetical protein
MRLRWIAAIALAMLAITAPAQGAVSSPSQSTAQPAPAASNAPGMTEVLVALTRSLNSKKVQIGDLVKAAVTQDVLVRGRIIIPRGSKLIGHITETKVRGENDKESFVGLIFDKAVLKGGEEINFNGTVSALAAPAPVIMGDDDPTLSPMGGVLRDQVGGPQHAPITPNSSRGTGLPSTDVPLDTSAVAMASAAKMNKDLGRPDGDRSGSGLMSAGSRGVFGLPNLKLQTEPAGGHGSVISSINRNVVLEGGTQMLIQVNIPVREQ